MSNVYIDALIDKGILPPGTKQYTITKSGVYTIKYGDKSETITLPQGEIFDWQKVADEIADNSPCKHEWVNAGFHFDKWVCKKCDVNKGSNE
jgi:hypothetical protein